MLWKLLFVVGCSLFVLRTAESATKIRTGHSYTNPYDVLTEEQPIVQVYKNKPSLERPWNIEKTVLPGGEDLGLEEIASALELIHIDTNQSLYIMHNGIRPETEDAQNAGRRAFIDVGSQDWKARLVSMISFLEYKGVNGIGVKKISDELVLYLWLAAPCPKSTL